MRYDLSDREIEYPDNNDVSYSVVVENVGTVINTTNYDEAEKCYLDYVEYAKITPTTDQVTLMDGFGPVLEFECLPEVCSEFEENEILVGMPVTRYDSEHRSKSWKKDRPLPKVECYPYSIVEVINEEKIVVRTDHYHCFNEERGYYKYTTDPNGVKITLSLRSNGLWYIVGHSIQHSHTWFAIGHRERSTRNEQ
jgi:uncharacterized protein YlzI (FlbEa/FlbD family)